MRTSTPRRRATVDQRRLLHVDRHVDEEADEQPDRERQRERDVGQHQPGVRVEQPQPLHHQVVGHDQHHARRHAHHQDEEAHRLGAAEPKAGEAVAGQRAQHQAAERGPDRDHQAVLQILHERDVGEHARVVVEDRREEPLRRAGVERQLGLEGRGGDPVDREQRPGQDGHAAPAPSATARSAGAHVSSGRARAQDRAHEHPAHQRPPAPASRCRWRSPRPCGRGRTRGSSGSGSSGWRCPGPPPVRTKMMSNSRKASMPRMRTASSMM